MLNNVVLMGRLVRDPEIRTTSGGKSVCSFSLAVERDFQREERQADFFDCTAWGNTADFIEKYFHKGRMIALQGRLQSRTYKDREGNSRKVVEVIADKVSFTGEKAESVSGPADPPSPANESQGRKEERTEPPAAYESGNIQEGFEELSGDDDLPF